MKITEIRRKKELKKKELASLKEDFNNVKAKQWTIFVIVCFFVVLSLSLLLFFGFSNPQEVQEVYDPLCIKANSCFNGCIDFYSKDIGVNHSLECDYKCLTYKYCLEG